MRVLSLGAGVQSSALAFMVEKGVIPPVDCAIFADTQAEPPEVYEWLDYIKANVSYPIHIVTAGSLEADAVAMRRNKKTNALYWKNVLPTFMQKKGTGGYGLFPRHCTTDYKIVPIKRKIRELLGKDWRKASVEQLIGISTDEASRMKDSRVKYIKNQWPLIEMSMCRSDCQNWMKDNGHPIPPKSACYFCPFHDNKTWQTMKTDSPKLFNKAVQFEKELQTAAKDSPKTYGVPFLHRSCEPINEAPLDTKQIGLFEAECEGMCGV